MRPHLIILLIPIILLLSHQGHGAFEFVEIGARPVAMGGAFCAVTEDVHGPHCNPAAVGYTLSTKLFMSYCRPFGLPGLDLQQIGLLRSTPLGVVGLSGGRFGNRLYRELTLSFSWARPLGDRGALGLRLRGLQLAIRDHGSDMAWCLDLGLVAVLTRQVHCGISARNLNDGRLGAGGEGMPQTLIIGLACRPNSRILLSADLLEDISDGSLGGILGGYPLEIRLGQELQLVELLRIRAGVLDPPVRFSAGLGLRTGPLQLNYAWRSHQFLGGTHYFSLTWP